MRLILWGRRARVLKDSSSADRGKVRHSAATGDMLRAAVQAGTEVGKRAKAVMDAGKLVSDDIVIAIVSERIDQPDCREWLHSRRFPHTLVQADATEAMLKEQEYRAVEVVEIRVDDKILADRVSGRYLRQLRCRITTQMSSRRWKASATAAVRLTSSVVRMTIAKQSSPVSALTPEKHRR